MIPKVIAVVGSDEDLCRRSARSWGALNPTWKIEVEVVRAETRSRCMNFRVFSEGAPEIVAYERVVRGGVVVAPEVVPIAPLDSLLDDGCRAFAAWTRQGVSPRIVGGEINSPFWWWVVSEVSGSVQKYRERSDQSGDGFLRRAYDTHGPAAGVVLFHNSLLLADEEECRRVGGVSHT